jgi:hypothetical protein
VSEDENIQCELDRDSASSTLTSATKHASPLLAWFLSGDKYLHEESLNGENSHTGKGALLYLFVFVLNEFIFRFIPHTGMGTLSYLLVCVMVVFLVVLILTFMSRRVLFGANTRRPDPVIGLPDQTATRHDYQNVIPAFPEKTWLIKRIAAYVDIQCCVFAAVITGWSLMFLVSIPYFLLQHAKII